MLHKNVLMQDIDVAQWRNAQSLLLDSAKERPRIIVLHDAGAVRKVAHSKGLAVASAPSRVDEPQAAAQALYEANQANVDFVAVFERSAFDAYFAAVQDSWDIDEELDAFVDRTFRLLDSFPDGMVTYPSKASETLGLQWRLGASREEVVEAAKAFIPAGSTIVLGVFADGGLWASLVLTFDESASVTSATTVDPSEVNLQGSISTVSGAVVEWVRATHGECSLGLFVDKSVAEEFLASREKAAVLRQAAGNGGLVLSPVPPALASALA
jgi:hypothetical protein